MRLGVAQAALRKGGLLEFQSEMAHMPTQIRHIASTW
jgi:hypothetical protein